MTADEYRAALKHLSLSLTEAGPFLGVSPVTSRRWASGMSAVPPTVDRFLRLVIALKMRPATVAEWIGE